MKITKVGKIRGCQDGAIYGSELFRFDHGGHCAVYDLKNLKVEDEDDGRFAPIGQFTLDRADEIVPHSNAVCFGAEFYEEGDTYPLLYSNIYNNYAKTDNPLRGVCCVYRLERTENTYKTTLVQLIEIGFCEDATLWRASEEKHGARPYGNFLVDRENRSYYAFVMRNKEKGTRYFRFDLPSVHDGAPDPVYGVKKVVLTKEDIRDCFDCGYHYYIQGAALHEGKIYSTEGFRSDEINRPAIRVIDLKTKSESYFDIMNMGFEHEPECIDFYNGVCYYSDAPGNLYTVEF